ncbi:MAG: hypothetical protein QNK35_11405 [Bacteroides sp.]|nr:hypothetical protein [Bacteroides sp.]
MNHVRISLLLLFITLSFSCKRSGIISIEADQLINETGFGAAIHWFDEADTLTVPLTTWHTPGTESYWPASVIIDFGQEIYIEELKVFDGEKSEKNESGEWEHRGGGLRFFMGSPFQWTEIGSLDLANNNTWQSFPLGQKMSFLRIEKVSTESYFWKEYGPFHCDVNIGDIVVIGHPDPGKKKEDSGTQVPQSPQARFPMQDFIGANSYKWIPDSINKAVGIIREYHHWGTNGVLDLDSGYTWYSSIGDIHMDEYLERIHTNDAFETFPDVHRHADPQLPGENKPAFGGDPAQPSSYAILADYFFQLAARYGHQEVDPGRLRLAPEETVLSGAGWLNYYECWNEPDRWWGLSEAHFTPYELAAMSSAAYDGHQQSMGENFGVKNADPGALLVLGGLTSLDLQYMDAMLLWANHFRDGSFPADVINFHHYSNSAGGQHQGENVRGISPEADSLKERLEQIVAWKDQNLPEQEIWLSEFGWDTWEPSPQSSCGHLLYPESIDMFQLQAIWLVRGYLAGAAAGIDRMFMYLANDLEHAGLYNNCGLVFNDNRPKRSWYYVSTLKNALSSTRFAGIVDSGREDMLIYSFESDDSLSRVLAMWCPTSDGNTVKDYTMKLPADFSKATLVEMVEGFKHGKRSPLNTAQGELTLTISEQPVFVELKRNP